MSRRFFTPGPWASVQFAGKVYGLPMDSGPMAFFYNNEEDFANNNLLYNVHSLDQFAGKKVVIAGGGDSAVDWANHLDGVAESVTLIHRRDTFRAHEHSVELLYQSSVNVMTPYVPLEIKGENGHAQS